MQRRVAMSAEKDDHDAEKGGQRRVTIVCLCVVCVCVCVKQS